MSTNEESSIDQWEIEDARKYKLAFTKKQVDLTNLAIMDLAIITMYSVRNGERHKLTFEDANTYHHVFYVMRDLLKQVDPECLKWHDEKITEFYREGRELSNDWDVLQWHVLKEK